MLQLVRRVKWLVSGLPLKTFLQKSCYTLCGRDTSTFFLLVKVEHVSNFKLTNDRTIPCIINYVAMCNSNIHHRQWCKIISGTISPLNDQAPLAMYIPQDFPDHDLVCTRSLESSTPFICLKICILIYICIYIYIQELKIHDNCCSKCFFATAKKKLNRILCMTWLDSLWILITGFIIYKLYHTGFQNK